jgi:hypothetical protein
VLLPVYEWAGAHFPSFLLIKVGVPPVSEMFFTDIAFVTIGTGLIKTGMLAFHIIDGRTTIPTYICICWGGHGHLENFLGTGV